MTTERGWASRSMTRRIIAMRVELAPEDTRGRGKV